MNGITVYIQHDVLTPHNIRQTWYGAPQCPAVGERVMGECGYEGARVSWTVLDVEWIDGVMGRSVTITCTGPTGREE
jgi:hypothetical protein